MEPGSLARAFAIIVDAFVVLNNNVRQNFGSSALTVLMLLFVYAGANVIAEEWDVREGLRRAFYYTDTEKAEVQRGRRADLLQVELRLIEASNRQISARLIQLLDEVPSAARARIVVIHNGVYSLSGFGMLRFDITHGEARGGRAVGDLASNLPVSQMNTYLGELIAGRCAVVQAGQVTEAVVLSRLQRLNIATFMGCPIVNAQRQILGALFLSWDNGDQVPADLVPVGGFIREAAGQVAVAIDLRPIQNPGDLAKPPPKHPAP